LTVVTKKWQGQGVSDSSTQPVALVSGAGRGIGRAVATSLSRAGHRVVLTARSVDELTATAAGCPGSALIIPGDITDLGFVESLFAQVESDWGPVDVLVANAGAGVSAPIADTTDEQWQQMLDVNLTAPFRCLRRAVPGMVERGYGRVVVIASVAAKTGEPYIAAYTASKHGVLGLVRSAAAELATTGVTVNAVCPGYVDTPMTDATISAIVDRTGRSPEDARRILEQKQPIGRLVRPDEVAEAVLFCVRNGGMTGQGINVDGGALQS
jgi:NAD(P)-dependent dehydrogenase (short-subunit alcohol dehydrogenase family)